MTDIDTVENHDVSDSESNPSPAVLRKMAMQFRQVSGPPWIALSDKITSDHITTLLDHSSKSQDIDFKKSKGSRYERFGYVLIGTGLFVFLTILVLPKNPEMYAQIVEWISILAAGGLGGYGVGIRRGKRQEKTS